MAVAGLGLPEIPSCLYGRIKDTHHHAWVYFHILLFYVGAHTYHGAHEGSRGPLYGAYSLLPCSCGFGESHSVHQVFKAVFSICVLSTLSQM